MFNSRCLFPLLGLVRFAAADFGLGVQVFMLAGETSVNKAKLDWDTTNTPNATYDVRRSNGTTNSFQSLANVTGNTYDDYGLSSAQDSYSYQILASSDSQSNVAVAKPFEPTGSYNTYDNTKPSGLTLKSNISANGVYYQYTYLENSNGSMSGIYQQTSSDGYMFTGNTSVLSGQTVCASANYSCHLERITFLQNPGTGQVVMWGHFENTATYDLAQVAVAYADPGSQFTFEGTYRPLGYDSRDLTFYADDDGSAYLISSYDTNTNMNIYGLAPNWTTITEVVAEVYPNQYREAPAMAKVDGTYYLFSSRASGWFPSQPEYITATDLKGPWTNASVFANTATFATQSGAVNRFPDGSYQMAADRWSANWTPANGPNRQLFLPMSVSSDGAYASSHFYPTVQYSDDGKAAGQATYGVQTGKIISVGKPSSSDAGSANISLANDGIQTDPTSFFTPSQTPFWYEIDLGANYTITQVDLTTRMVQGSETYYGFNVTGSADGAAFELIADQSANTDVGFVASVPANPAAYRFVRIKVASVVNTHNQNSATWTAGLGEVTVYGKDV